MATKNGLYKGMAWVNPYLYVQDVDKSIDFYKKAFGFEVFRETNKDENGVTVHCELKHEEGIVMLGKEHAFGENISCPATSKSECPISLYLYCSDVDALCKKAKDAGATVLAEPETQFWGDRMCRIKDLNGYLWSFATYQGE